MKSMDGFFKSLSEEDWKQAEAIEKEAMDLLEQGLSGDAAMGLVRLVMELRAKAPNVTVAGTLEAVFMLGIQQVRAAMAFEVSGKKSQRRARGVRGV